MLRIICLATAIMLSPTVQAACVPHGEAKEHLEKKFNEKPAWWGLSAAGHVILIYQSKTSWTLVSVTPSGRACPIDAGGEAEEKLDVDL